MLFFLDTLTPSLIYLEQNQYWIDIPFLIFLKYYKIPYLKENVCVGLKFVTLRKNKKEGWGGGGFHNVRIFSKTKQTEMFCLK